MENMSIEDWIKRLPEAFIPEKAAGVDTKIQLHLSGTGGGDWFMIIQNQKLTVEPGIVENPRLSVSGNAQEVLQILSGQMDGMRAFMQGKIKLSGDIGMAMRMANMFKAP